MTSMIRGYGLPSEGASSYNGYAGHRHVAGCCVSPRYRSLFTKIPDPELGGFDGFGAAMIAQSEVTAATGVTTQGATERAYAPTLFKAAIFQPPPPTTRPEGSGGLGMGVLAAGAVALFLLFK